ncbi:hypothetical protein AiwAL_12790 [Acidiphilium sp. AL]|uniref:Uncharacterized protein n=1 Tax=Acidiphilium iwatense TaxID=768198 RepID=A0ABS9DTT4_9PROT|nr:MULTISPECIES: hypothetical protein [Acidiphilium]MCF3946102.1 hypothetical protein [Acidiphilium iwatense]MCU4160972.1 hypothetical protein [Acidiphilium sp. AL]
MTAPIASATSLAQLDDLVKAASLALSDTAIETLNRASAAPRDFSRLASRLRTIRELGAADFGPFKLVGKE